MIIKEKVWAKQPLDLEFLAFHKTKKIVKILFQAHHQAKKCQK